MQLNLWILRLEPPSPPRNFTHSISNTTLNLSWDEPQGCDINDLSYVIEEALDERHEKWMQTTILTETTYTIHHLSRSIVYKYRICSKNFWGRSSWVESELITVRAAGSVVNMFILFIQLFSRHSFFSIIAPPSPPTAPLEFRQIALNTMLIEWGIPETDGGEPLENYIIMLKDRKKNIWIEVGKTDVTKFVVKDLEVILAWFLES